MFFLTTLIFITLAVYISQYLAFKRMYTYVSKELGKEPPKYLPKLAVILPCKGLDPGFQENIKKLLEQDYKQNNKINFEVIFSVSDVMDPAYQALKSVLANYKHLNINTKIVVAGINPSRAQKINNQIAALKEVSEDVEAFAFVDSDVIARQDFLSHLVGNLEEEGVGATTGYRFYIAHKKDAASILRSIWNRVSAWEMASPKYCFAWGGAMAIKRDCFYKAQILSHWDKAADDDLSLTTAVKSLGLKIKFVPQCLVASHGDANWAEVIEWTNRQLILTKVYYPELWKRGIARALIMAIWLISILICTTIFFINFLQFSSIVSVINKELFSLNSLALFVGLSVLPIEAYFLLKGQKLWERVLANTAYNLRSSKWNFVLALPLAHLTLPWLTLYSVCTNRIKWRGIRYELRSPKETLVIQELDKELAQN